MRAGSRFAIRIPTDQKYGITMIPMENAFIRNLLTDMNTGGITIPMENAFIIRIPMGMKIGTMPMGALFIIKGQMDMNGGINV